MPLWLLVCGVAVLSFFGAVRVCADWYGSTEYLGMRF
jgi:hypothetical protein